MFSLEVGGLSSGTSGRIKNFKRQFSLFYLLKNFHLLCMNNVHSGKVRRTQFWLSTTTHY